ncbi:hypothetical protein V3C99_017116, partial [Haemonchus contortus]
AKTMASSSGGPDVKDSVFCINCRQQIQLRLHVKCCECPAMICAECFSYGCEAGQHLRGHNYEICDPLGGRTFDVKGSWGAIEERKLLAAAYRFKLGNWGEVTRLMETNRPISQVQEYYDRFFIRGPVGQFALKLLSWEESKRIMLADGSLVYNCETDRIIYLLMAMDAYKDSKEKLDPCDEDLASKVDAIMQSYTFHLKHNDETHQCSEQAELPAIIDLALSDDSCDPSDYDMEKKAPDDAYSTGLEPENDSEEDEVNNHSVPHSKPTKVDSRSLRSSLRTSVAFMRPRKKKISVRKSAVEKNERTRRYRTVQPDSSSSDDDSGNEDEVEPMETDRTSIDDAHDSMHGLEKEDSTDDCSGSDSEEPKQEAAKQSATSLNSSVRKKRRARFVSKKARRLKEFQKRMARMTKVAERRLHELSELCPLETIRELRNSKPDLALYTNDYVGRPKVRQSDMDMLAYNAARGDFEWEWFNDAEQLISRLMIQESSDRVEDLENDIKFARIEKYYRTLKTRKAYRRAIVEHDKISEFFRFMMNMTMEKRKASQIFAQRPPLEKLLIRAQQCLTKRETEDLRSHVERADELMGRIAKLQELQRNGVTTLKDIINPFALSASFIALLPMPDGFVDECFTFLEKVSKKSTQPRQNPTKRSTKSSLSWKWKPSERLVSAGKPINVGIKANGKTTINTLFEEFWKTPKDFSTISVFNKEESMTSQSPSNESSKESLDQPVDGLIRKPYTTSSKQSILTEFVDNYDSVSGIRSSTVLKKSKQKTKANFGRRPSTLQSPSSPKQASDSFSVDEEKNIKPCKRWRKRKDSVVDEVRPATEVMRPFKKLKIEMRKRRRAKTSEDEGPTIAKQRMTKPPPRLYLRELSRRTVLMRSGKSSTRKRNILKATTR